MTAGLDLARAGGMLASKAAMRRPISRIALSQHRAAVLRFRRDQPNYKVRIGWRRVVLPDDNDTARLGRLPRLDCG